jgi:hypothetical protein
MRFETAKHPRNAEVPARRPLASQQVPQTGQNEGTIYRNWGHSTPRAHSAAASGWLGRVLEGRANFAEEGPHWRAGGARVKRT